MESPLCIAPRTATTSSGANAPPAPQRRSSTLAASAPRFVSAAAPWMQAPWIQGSMARRPPVSSSTTMRSRDGGGGEPAGLMTRHGVVSTGSQTDLHWILSH